MNIFTTWFICNLMSFAYYIYIYNVYLNVDISNSLSREVLKRVWDPYRISLNNRILFKPRHNNWIESHINIGNRFNYFSLLSCPITINQSKYVRIIITYHTIIFSRTILVIFWWWTLYRINSSHHFICKYLQWCCNFNKSSWTNICSISKWNFYCFR